MWPPVNLLSIEESHLGKTLHMNRFIQPTGVDLGTPTRVRNQSTHPSKPRYGIVLEEGRSRKKKKKKTMDPEYLVPNHTKNEVKARRKNEVKARN